MKSSLFLSLIVSVLFVGNVIAQVTNQPQTQVTDLEKLKVELLQKNYSDDILIKLKATELGLPLRIEHQDGSISELERFLGDFPLYITTNNRIAAISTATSPLWPGGASRFSLTGKGFNIGEWDGGAVRLTHQEFGGRAIQRDGALTLSNHATHVAGTLIGAGVRSDAIGMAPEAGLWAHDWNSDNAEMADAALNGLLISNHSYGNIAGWANGDWSTPGTNEWHWWGDPNISATEDYKFGFYDSKAAVWDEIAHTAPYYLIVKSAGNDRNNAGSLNHKVFLNGQWQSSSELRPRDGGDLGFDCLPTYSTSKNILTIGAVNDLPSGYNGPQSVAMSSFSGYGPTDDGRIKPDIVGNGIGLNSSTSNDDTSYGSLSGTSMSGPNVAGSLLLLQELYQRYHPNPMLSSTLKGLVIQTADEAGPYQGPDYQFGWGLLNTTKAAEVIQDNGVFQFIIENTLFHQDTFTKKIYVNGSEEVKITLCWTDPAGAPNSPSLNDRTPKLINDLDLRLISDSDENEVYFPYTLNPDSPASPPSLMDNQVDNIEQINAGILPEGSYTIRITHKENLRSGKQTFSLISNRSDKPCLLGIAADVQIPLKCNNDEIEKYTLPASFEGNSLEYSLDLVEFNTDSTLYNLREGRYHVWIRDENGCIGLQRIQVIPSSTFDISLKDTAVFFALNAEEKIELERTSSRSSGWGGNLEDRFIHSHAVIVDDGSENSSQGCGDLVNTSKLFGNIAVFDRGGCEFGFKALKAQQAGAVAAIIINNVSGPPVPMATGAVGNQVNIPVFMIAQSSGENLRSGIEEGKVKFSFGSIKAISPATCDQLADGALRPTLIGGDPDSFLFNWSNGNSSLINENIKPGNYLLTVTNEDGCVKEFDLIVPTLAGPELKLDVAHESCLDASDGSINIQNLSSLERFNIKFNGSAIDTSTLEKLLPGDYEFLLTDTFNNCIYSSLITILPGADLLLEEISGSEIAVEGMPVFYSISPVPGALYNWQTTNGQILGGQGTNEVELVFGPSSEALISVTITLDNCSKSTQKKVIIESSSTRNNLQGDLPFIVLPNPFYEHFRLEAKTTIISPYIMQMVDINNVPVWKGKWNGEQSLELNTENFHPGFYILQFKNELHSGFLKLIKQ